MSCQNTFSKKKHRPKYINNHTWSFYTPCFLSIYFSQTVLQASSHVTRIDIFLSLVQLLKQTTTGNDTTNQPSNNIDGVGINLMDCYQKPTLPRPISLAETLGCWSLSAYMEFQKCLPWWVFCTLKSSHTWRRKRCCWSIPFPPSLKWGECDVHRVDRVGRIYTRWKKLQAFFLPFPNESCGRRSKTMSYNVLGFRLGFPYGGTEGVNVMHYFCLLLWLVPTAITCL